MEGSFPRFGPAHLIALATFPLLALVLAWMARKLPRSQKAVRLSLAVALLAAELGWFAILYTRYRISLKWLLPLHLSDASILLTVLAVFTLRQKLFDVVFYWGLTAVPLAMLMPDILEPFPDPFTIAFFVLHGLVVTILLYLVWSGAVRPGRGSVWRSLAALNAFMLFVLAANALLKTNYMFLMEKPSQASLLDYFGPWPVYILTCEVVALVLFGLLGIPFQGMGFGAPRDGKRGGAETAT